jgi:hypothetical protein
MRNSPSGPSRPHCRGFKITLNKLHGKIVVTLYRLQLFLHTRMNAICSNLHLPCNFNIGPVYLSYIRQQKVHNIIMYNLKVRILQLQLDWTLIIWLKHTF